MWCIVIGRGTSLVCGSDVRSLESSSLQGRLFLIVLSLDYDYDPPVSEPLLFEREHR